MKNRMALALALVPSALACSSRDEGYASPADASASPPFEARTPSLSNGDGGSNTADDCSDAAKLVYVLSAEFDLYSFTPNTLTFKRIGHLACPGSGVATPNSMAVDRSGIAWVNYSDGSLFKVNTNDASCTATPYQPGQSNFFAFGMAFASNSSGSKEETLYVAGIGNALTDVSPGFGKLDQTTYTLTKIGNFSGPLRGLSAELTGTGEGKLFGFFTTRPEATLAQIDPSTGATSNARTLSGVSTPSAWAFSFWAGDFWFYTSTDREPSTVTQLRTSSDNSIATVIPNVGDFRIVGAGVSTCAPTSPIR